MTWRTVKKNENYLIDTNGRVKSRYTNRIISQSEGKTNYRTVRLYEAGQKPAVLYVHLLMAEAFIPGYIEGNHIAHKNDNTLDNRLQNLMVAPRNFQRKWIGGITAAMDVAQIRIVETGEVFPSVKAVALHLKCDSKNVIAVLKGRRNRAGGHSFEYYEPPIKAISLERRMYHAQM